jgi:hypothetical protein
MLAIKDAAGVIVFAIFYGFFSGAGTYRVAIYITTSQDVMLMICLPRDFPYWFNARSVSTPFCAHVTAECPERHQAR